MSEAGGDHRPPRRHNPNVELIAQGVANVISPMVGGLPVTRAIARTATNIRSGARTPMAGVIHAVTLLIVLLAGADLAGLIPMRSRMRQWGNGAMKQWNGAVRQ